MTEADQIFPFVFFFCFNVSSFFANNSSVVNVLTDSHLLLSASWIFYSFLCFFDTTWGCSGWWMRLIDMWLFSTPVIRVKRCRRIAVRIRARFNMLHLLLNIIEVPMHLCHHLIHTTKYVSHASTIWIQRTVPLFTTSLVVRLSRPRLKTVSKKCIKIWEVVESPEEKIGISVKAITKLENVEPMVLIIIKFCYIFPNLNQSQKHENINQKQKS